MEMVWVAKMMHDIDWAGAIGAKFRSDKFKRWWWRSKGLISHLCVFGIVVLVAGLLSWGIYYLQEKEDKESENQDTIEKLALLDEIRAIVREEIGKED